MGCWSTSSSSPAWTVAPVHTTDGFRDCLLDWAGLIEKAVEVHCINSSFIHLAASFGRAGVFHDFGRDAEWGGRFVLPANWRAVRERC